MLGNMKFISRADKAISLSTLEINFMYFRTCMHASMFSLYPFTEYPMLIVRNRSRIIHTHAGHVLHSLYLT